jgi:hypothetical protein
MSSLLRRGALGLALAALCASPVLADPPSGDLGITLNPVVGGFHESFDDIVRLPPIPVPLIEGNYKVSNFELTGYGLPPTVAIPYTDAIQGSTALRLSILDATVRVWDGSGHVAVGAGETIYNQTTHYATADIFTTSGGERQYSRIAGAHYELATHIPFLRGRLETSLRYAPVLLGTQVSTYDDGAPSRFDPEIAEQIDGNVEYVRHAGRHLDEVIGVRYVNFTAAYDVPLRPLSDRNCAVLPSFGYLWRL